MVIPNFTKIFSSITGYDETDGIQLVDRLLVCFVVVVVVVVFRGEGYTILNLSNILRMKHPTKIITIGIKQLLCTFQEK